MTHKTVVYKYGTGNPVEPNGSGDVRDGIDNLQSFDVFMNAEEDTYNQRDGQVVQTVVGAIRSVGFKPGAGDFTSGFTVMPGQYDYAWYDPVSKNHYAYLGVIPASGHVVHPATDPVDDPDWKPVTDELLRSELASQSGSSMIGFTQSGIGATQRTAQDKMRDFVSSKDMTSIDSINNFRVNNTTSAILPVGSYTTSSGIDLTGYFHITGFGDQSQLNVTSGTALEYVSNSGVYDDYPHTFVEKFRITGDGTFASYPNAQNGTTIGMSFSTVDNIGSFGSATGMTFDQHAIGRYIERSFTHQGQHNYYRANKIGLLLERVTSHTEINCHWRYNSDAAIDIIGGENIKISGGAVQGNPGRGLRFRNHAQPAGAGGLLILDNCYFEVNGNKGTGVPSIDIPYGSQTQVEINGGVYPTNVNSGVTSGPYMLGDNARITNAVLTSTFFAKNLALINCGGNFPYLNSYDNEANTRIYGLFEPCMLTEYKPMLKAAPAFNPPQQGYAFCVNATGRTAAKVPGVTNLINTTYPYSYRVDGGPTSSQDATINYGDGDFFKVSFAPAIGNYNANCATIGSFSDITKPFRLLCVMLYAYQDCEMGFVQSSGGQSVNNVFQLKANTYYKFITMSVTTMSATCNQRMFPLNTAAPQVSVLPLWSSAHDNHSDMQKILSLLVDGVI